MNDSRNGNGSTLATLTTSQPNAEYNETFTVSNPTRPGYIFTGWTISGMDTSSHTIGGTTTTSITATGVKATEFCNLRIDSKEKVIFSANWKPITYEVIINRNGGGDTYTTTATFDQAFTVNTPTRDSYNFLGWNITGMSTDVTHHYGSNTTTASQISKTTATSFLNLHSVQDAEVTFTAQWTPNHTCDLYDIVTEATCETAGTTERGCKNSQGVCPIYGTKRYEITETATALNHLNSKSGGSKGTCNTHHHVTSWLCTPASISKPDKAVEHITQSLYPGCFDDSDGDYTEYNYHEKNCTQIGCGQDGYYPFTGRTIIHCARKTSIQGKYGVQTTDKNGATVYYCGQYGQSWCSTSWGPTVASVVFKCVCSTNGSTRTQAKEVLWVASDNNTTRVYIELFLGAKVNGKQIFNHNNCEGYICFKDTYNGKLQETSNPYGTITINPNGGIMQDCDVTSYTTGSTVTMKYYKNGFKLPNATKNGADVIGWVCSCSQHAGNIYPAGTVFTTSNASKTSHTFVAKWAYKITLNSGGATSDAGTTVYYQMSNGNKYSTEQCTTKISKISTPIPKLNNNIFQGYYSSTTGGTQYINSFGTFSSSAVFTQDTTLYAQWKRATSGGGIQQEFQ